MSDSNSLRLIRMPESSYGVPIPALARLMDVTGEGLELTLDFTSSERIAADRNNQGTIATAARVKGAINNEFSFAQNIPEIESALFNRFNRIAFIENTAVDLEITQVLNSTDTITVANGGLAFKAGHLVLLSGFANANNSGIFKVASSTATSIVLAGAPVLTDESAPPLGASVRVVGFEGVAGDITATATGLASTAYDFTTVGLVVHQFIKIGGAAVGQKYNTPALNGYARITAITANAITLDNLPLVGWQTQGQEKPFVFGQVIIAVTAQQKSRILMKKRSPRKLFLNIIVLAVVWLISYLLSLPLVALLRLMQPCLVRHKPA